jgi:phosphoenolpyruvate carboxykinase (ATP)
LNPQDTYENPADWDKKARKLTAMFVENFAQYTDTANGQSLTKAGPKAA